MPSIIKNIKLSVWHEAHALMNNFIMSQNWSLHWNQNSWRKHFWKIQDFIICYSSPRFERIHKQTDIQREEIFENTQPNLEVQVCQLEVDNQKLIEVSLMVDKIVYKDQEEYIA